MTFKKSKIINTVAAIGFLCAYFIYGVVILVGILVGISASFPEKLFGVGMIVFPLLLIIGMTLALKERWTGKYAKVFLIVNWCVCVGVAVYFISRNILVTLLLIVAFVVSYVLTIYVYPLLTRGAEMLGEPDVLEGVEDFSDDMTYKFAKAVEEDSRRVEREVRQREMKEKIADNIAGGLYEKLVEEADTVEDIDRLKQEQERLEEKIKEELKGKTVSEDMVSKLKKEQETITEEAIEKLRMDTLRPDTSTRRGAEIFRKLEREGKLEEESKEISEEVVEKLKRKKILDDEK